VGADVADPDLSRLYRDTRERVISLVSGLDDDALDTWVPACPRWCVRDVLAHLTAVAEDAVAGRLTGVPSEDETAAQVARFRGREVAEITASWAEVAGPFERMIGSLRVWPAVIDVTSHEHDMCAALGRPAARGTQAVWYSAQRLLAGLRPPVSLRVAVEDAEFTVGPGSGPELGLTTTRFEALRWRMGRRSRAQLAGLDWSGDPAAVIDHLVVFGPAGRDIVE
jgi:uncharacterized protein (TIGR03083 family)